MALPVRLIGWLALMVAACVPSSASAEPQVICGSAGTDPDGQQLQLVVVHGAVNCTEATQVLHDYRASSDRQGSGGFVHLGDWECAHNSIAGYEQTRRFDVCTRGTDMFATQAATGG